MFKPDTYLDAVENVVVDFEVYLADGDSLFVVNGEHNSFNHAADHAADYAAFVMSRWPEEIVFVARREHRFTVTEADCEVPE